MLAATMSSNKKAIAGVDNTFRKTWDKGEYEDKAKERKQKVSDILNNKRALNPPGWTSFSFCEFHVSCRKMTSTALWTPGRGRD